MAVCWATARFNSAYGGNTFVNNGTVNANVSGQSLTFNPDGTTNNSGAILAASNGGILNLSSATTTNSGTLRVGTGSTANLTNNFVSNAGSLIDAAHGTVNLQGITVTGTVTGTAGTLLNFGNRRRQQCQWCHPERRSKPNQ